MARSLRAVVASENDTEAAPLVSVSPPKRRRPSWVLVGVVLVGLAALLGAYVFSTVNDRLSVMVASRDLEPGRPIAAGDLRVVEMGRTSSLRAIQPDQQSLIIGQAPRGPVPEGTVLNTGLFVPAGQVVPVGAVVVGGSFTAGAVPTASLSAGDAVVLLVVGPSSAGGVSEVVASPVVLGRATVWAVNGSAAGDASTSRVWVSLLVAEDLQTAAAQAASDGRLRLGLVASS